VDKKGEKFICFLLTDLFLITKPLLKKNETYYALQQEPWDYTDFDVRTIVSKSTTMPERSFTVSSSAHGMLLFQADTEEEKQKWLKNLEEFAGLCGFPCTFRKRRRRKD
jgi:hypothetical protein